MLRNFGVVLALSLVAPASALACGMYIPEEIETKATLADMLDSIDEVALKPQDEKPAQVVNAEADPQPTASTENVQKATFKKQRKHADS